MWKTCELSDSAADSQAGLGVRTVGGHERPIPLAQWERERYRLVSLAAIVNIDTGYEVAHLLRRLDEFRTDELHFRRADVLLGLNTMKTGFEYFGMRSCLRELAPTLHVIETGDEASFSMPYVQGAMAELLKTARTELHSVYFLHLDPSRAAIYEQEHPFGKEVSEAFPSCAFEISEAAKCAALYRSTASVLHLMRCLEVVVRVIARGLGVDPDSCDKDSLGTLFVSTNKIIAARRSGPKTTQAVLEEAEYLSKISFRLEAAKDAWRNASSHARAKYTEEEAVSIAHGIAGLMRELSKDARFHEPKPATSP